MILNKNLRRFSVTLVSPARVERTCESIRFSVRFGPRGHAMEVENISNGESPLGHAFGTGRFYTRCVSALVWHAKWSRTSSIELIICC